MKDDYGCKCCREGLVELFFFYLDCEDKNIF